MDSQDNFRHNNIPIVFIRDCHKDVDDWEFIRSGKHALENTNQFQVIEELDVQSTDILINKTRYSSFYRTDLEVTLSNLGINTLVLTGNQTHVCIQNTALDAFYRGLRVIIPKQCVVSAHLEFKNKGLEYIERYVGEVTDINSIEYILK